MMSAPEAQQQSFLDSLIQKSGSGCVLVDYEFTATVSGIKTIGEGKVEIQGNSYHMKGNGMEIYCDGSSTWLIDEAAGEVVVEDADTQSAGYLANPVLLLMNLEKNVVSYDADGNKISLELPGGVFLTIVINSIKTMPEKKSEAFRPPTQFDSSWIITDLR